MATQRNISHSKLEEVLKSAYKQADDTLKSRGKFIYSLTLFSSCRIHAEFQLNEVPNFPFWFTPGQFTGNIVLSKDASHIRQFRLYVPNNR